MKVRGYSLPKLLQELIAQGQWKKPKNVTGLQQMIGCQYPEDFTFLSIEGMERESNPLPLVEEEKLAEIYSIASSQKLGHPITDDEILDINKAVFIAINWSEEAICLDYRFFHDNPRVVAFVCTEKQFTKWKVIASDFPSFWKTLNFPL